MRTLRALVAALRQTPLERRHALAVFGDPLPLQGQLLVAHPLDDEDPLERARSNPRRDAMASAARAAAMASSKRRCEIQDHRVHAVEQRVERVQLERPLAVPNRFVDRAP